MSTPYLYVHCYLVYGTITSQCSNATRQQWRWKDYEQMKRLATKRRCFRPAKAIRLVLRVRNLSRNHGKTNRHQTLY